MIKTDEKSGLYISITGSFIFGFLGVAFAIITGSQAVLLDGAFNLIGALMGIVGLEIAKSLGRPESEHYPIGFYALESLFVLGKGLILLLLTTYVIVNNVIILMNGGSELNLGMVLIYLSVALVGNIIVYALVRRKSARAGSPILSIEKENWKVNTLITASIAVAILIGYLFQNTFLREFIKYVDQVIVILVALISISVPFKAIKEGLGDLLLFAPAEEMRNKARSLVEKQMTSFKSVTMNNMLMVKTGRKIWLSLFIYSRETNIATDLPDQIKAKVTSAMDQEFPDINVDVIVSRQ